MGISITKKFIAELIGTFTLVLIGCGAASISGGETAAGFSGLSILGVALAFGISFLVMAYAIGNISGCHINPAITLAMFIAGKIKITHALAYIIAQLFGSVLAAIVLIFIAKGQPSFTMGEWALDCNGWGEGYQNGYNTFSAFLTEMVLTFLFLFVVLSTRSRWGNSNMAGLAAGFMLVLIHLVGIPVTGASFNPARSFGPAVFAGGKAMDQLWLFFIAPLAGAAGAAILWPVFDRTID